MSNETKQEVFEYYLDMIKAIKDLLAPECVLEARKRYYAALPDDLPVVSKDVSNTMRTYRFLWWKEFLDKAYDNELSGYEDINYKVRSESAEVVRAWVLGVWRVEETGEIVKLEAEK